MTDLILKPNETAQITQQDMVTVAVAKAEKHIREQLARSIEKVSNLEIQLRTNSKNTYTEIETAIREQLKEHLQKLEEGITGLGIKATTNIICQSYDSTEIKYTIRIAVATNNYGPEATGTIKTPPKVAELYNTTAQLSEELTAERKAIVEYRNQLNNIPILERQYRAKFVEDQLKQSEGGRALLASIGNTLIDDIKAIAN